MLGTKLQFSYRPTICIIKMDVDLEDHGHILSPVVNNVLFLYQNQQYDNLSVHTTNDILLNIVFSVELHYDLDV